MSSMTPVGSIGSSAFAQFMVCAPPDPPPAPPPPPPAPPPASTPPPSGTRALSELQPERPAAPSSRTRVGIDAIVSARRMFLSCLVGLFLPSDQSGQGAGAPVELAKGPIG